MSMSHVVAKALAEAGVIHDLDTVQRVIIDLRAREPVQIYVQRLGGADLRELLPAVLTEAKPEVIESEVAA
jgi:hypothetical protein